LSPGHYIATVKEVENKVFKNCVEIHLKYLVTSGPYQLTGLSSEPLPETKNLATELPGRFTIKTVNHIPVLSPFSPYYRAWSQASGHEPRDNESPNPQELVNHSFLVEVGPRSDTKPELIVRTILWKTGF